MALGTGPIRKLFETSQATDSTAELRNMAARLRAQAPHDATAAAMLKALEADVPEVRAIPALPTVTPSRRRRLVKKAA